MTRTSDLKKAGLKTTLPRLKILGLLEQSDVRHLGAEDLYKMLLDTGEDIGLGTVYRVLTQFESAGIVIRHNFEGGRAVFELNDEGHHDHMVCVECGQVFEFFDETIEQRQRQVAESAGFIIDEHSLYMYGVCAGKRAGGECSMEKSKKPGIMEVRAEQDKPASA